MDLGWPFDPRLHTTLEAAKKNQAWRKQAEHTYIFLVLDGKILWEIE